MLEKLRVSPRTFSTAAWGVFAYNLVVILWGALVRATGSGAGCGDHWPLCNGQVVPRAPATATLIEFTHRATSGLCLVAVAVLMLTALASFPRGHAVRRAAVASFVFVVLEAIIGAGIVLLKLVADDDSITRGVSMGLHLVNTFLLLGALTLTAWWSRHPTVSFRARPGVTLAAMVGFAALALTGMTGAIAALGDTLFPSAPYHVAPTPVVETARHLFLELRILHPVAAVAGALYWATLAGLASMRARSMTLSNASLVVFVGMLVQLGLGVVNVALRAPLWLQIVHLAVADVLVAACVVFSVEIVREGFGFRAKTAGVATDVKDVKGGSAAHAVQGADVAATEDARHAFGK